jgi:hypothetical protein
MAEFAAYIEAVLAVVWAIWYGMAALIIWRRPTDRGAVVAAFFLILFPALWGAVLLPRDASLIGAPLTLAPVVGLILFCLLFPEGRFTPRWTRWLGIASVPTTIFVVLSSWWGSTILFILFLFVLVGVQVYRFRSVSTWEQRQQTKWAFFGVIIAVLGFATIITTYAFPWASTGTVYGGSSTSAVALVPTAIPLSLGIAVLRNRLWDIDRVINRALVYSALSLTLAAIYIGGVIGLQALFRLVVGSSSTLAIALSTLAIAALFGPLRRRIPSGIDRRCYRSKYDAERTLAAFGERLRDEVDLKRLSQELTAVVGESLHPEHVSLWLREG